MLCFQTIATGTLIDRNVFYVSRFEQLDELVNILKANILTFVLEGSYLCIHMSFRLSVFFLLFIFGLFVSYRKAILMAVLNLNLTIICISSTKP